MIINKTINILNGYKRCGSLSKNSAVLRG